MNTNKILEFQYDILISRENFCNRTQEIKEINHLVNKNQRVVLSAPRRYGKTSLIRNIIAEDFVKSHAKAMFFYFNFMEVSSLESIADRMSSGITAGLTRFAKVKSFITPLLQYFKNTALSVSVDPISNLPSFELKGGAGKPTQKIEDIFAGLKKMAAKQPVLLIFDEFQDIANIKEAQGIMRDYLQTFNKTPVVMLGSQQSMLSEMFASNKAAFFSYGQEIRLKPLRVDDWFPYFNERLKLVGSSISMPAMQFLCEELQNVPNSICEMGFWFCTWFANTVIDTSQVTMAIRQHTEQKDYFFRFQLAGLSEAEKSVLIALANAKYLEQIGAKVFMRQVKPSLTATRKIFDRLMLRGMIEHEAGLGYRVSDPLLKCFLKTSPM